MPWTPVAKDYGTNVFFRDGERLFRTYFVNNRGDEALGSTWSYLDLTPLGRQESWEESPAGYPKTAPYVWWNWHDAYQAEVAPDPRWNEIVEVGVAAFQTTGDDCDDSATEASCCTPKGDAAARPLDEADRKKTHA